MLQRVKSDLLLQLKSKIQQIQGFKVSAYKSFIIDLGIINLSFPNYTFPIGTVHEFLTPEPGGTASTIGFLTPLLASLTNGQKVGVWISSKRKLFPPSLANFGFGPERLLFVDVAKESDVQWAIEESLKCSALTTVVAEVNDISFTASRRLQLAVEQSSVTGFLFRGSAKQKPGTTACAARWRVTSLPSDNLEELPGIGFPKWRVELLRIRSGRPGVWNVEWRNGRYITSSIQRPSISASDYHLEKAG